MTNKETTDKQKHLFVQLLIATVSNLRCKYTYKSRKKDQIKGKPQFMDASTARVSLDSYVRLAKSENIASIRVTFNGGDPLLNWGVIEKTIRYANQSHCDSIQFTWDLCTRGTLTTKKIASELQREQVTVHINQDHPTEGDYDRRTFKDGTSSFNRIIKPLGFLQQYQCKTKLHVLISQDTFLSLQKLIDVCAFHGVKSVTLGLPDRENGNFLLTNHEKTAQKIVEAIESATDKRVTINGPWEQAIFGNGWTTPFLGNILHFKTDTYGTITPTPFPELPLGPVTNPEAIFLPVNLQKIRSACQSIRANCQECELATTCGGHLKAMAMPHAPEALANGTAWCQLTPLILDRLVGHKTKNRKRKNINRAMVVSTQLKLKTKEKIPHIVHQLTGEGIVATPDIIELLNFYKLPATLSTLVKSYLIPNLRQNIDRLRKLHFLNPVDTDEELNWLHKQESFKGKQQLLSDHFHTYFAPEHKLSVREQIDFMETLYQELVARGFPSLPHKILFFSCRNRSEFKQFWGDAPLPDWPKAFIIAGRILVVDANRIARLDYKSTGFKKGMTHELLHVFFHQLHCHLPLWFEEGLCEYFSQPYNPTAFKRSVRRNGVFGLQEMGLFPKHSLLDLDNAPVRENICYRQSHAFVAYLVSVFGERKLLYFARKCCLGENWNDVFRKTFGISLSQCENKWDQSLGFSSAKVQKNNVYKKLRPSKNLRVIKTNSSHLLYNSFTGSSLIATPEIEELVTFMESGRTIKEIQGQYDIDNLETILSSLYAKSLIIFDHIVEQNLPYRKFSKELIESGGLINTLRLNISNLCNMRCTYCYVEQDSSPQGNMSWQVAEKSLRHFFTLLQTNNRTRAFIRFFGGEPLLNWRVVYSTLEYVALHRNEIEVEYLLNTNGTILNKDIAKTLAKHKVIVAISLDGAGDPHDQCRKFHSGTGTFASVERGLEICLKNGCWVGLETTLTTHNIDHLHPLIDYLDEKARTYSQTMRLSLQSLCMDASCDKGQLGFRQKVDKVLAAIDYAKDKRVTIDNGMIHFPYSKLLSGVTCGVYCGAMGEEICVHPSGNVYPCGALQLKLGSIDNFANIFTSKHYNRLVKRVVGNIKECRGCAIEAFCAGGCAADAIKSKGDIFQSTKNCLFEKEIFTSLVKSKLQMEPMKKL